LFTSLLPPILVEGVAEAIANSTAVKTFICNLMTQPGETDGFTSYRHLETIKEYTPGIKFDYLIVNNQPISKHQHELYAVEGAEQIGVHGSIAKQTAEGTKIIFANLLDQGDMVRHDPAKLATLIMDCAVSRHKN
jgi:uncharacterized cofD-like protein